MIKLFRNIRKNLLIEGKTTKYFKYAIGEIILVMIGILLAVQVNNWNEKRRLQVNINNALRTISYDLATDTTFASGIIKYYEDNQKNSQKILNREITKENYKDCPQCVSLVTIYQPFNIQTKGYERLKILSEEAEKKDSLLTDITQVYAIYIPLIEKSNTRMESFVMGNFSDFESYPWFVDLTQGKFTDEMISYFTESEDYRKRVAAHNILAAGNHLTLTKQYKLNAEEILKRIKKRLDTENL